jgi:hypothetical protein
MTSPIPNVVNMEAAARLIREAKEAREKHKMWVQSINMPFERLPVCACDSGFGDPPSALQMIACGQCSGANKATAQKEAREARRKARNDLWNSQDEAALTRFPAA